MNDISTDVCIVGSGVAGIAIARRLAASNLRVTLLESGATKQTKLSKDLARGEHVGTPYWSLDFTRSRQFGGTATRWFLKLADGRPGLRVRPLDPIDFEKRSGIKHSGWPIAFDDLSSYFGDTEALFGITSGEDWNPERDASLFASESSDVRSVNFRFSPSELFTSTYKTELDRSNVQVLLETTVLNLEMSQNGSSVERLLARGADGSRFSVKAARVVLACGGIETPRLLLLSKDANGTNIGTATDNIGRYFMEHPHLLSGIVIPNDTTWLSDSTRYVKHVYEGVTQMSKLAPSEDLVRAHSLVNFCAHLSRSSSIEGHGFQQTKAYDALRILRSYAKGGSMPMEFGRYAAEAMKGAPRVALEGFRQIRSKLSSSGSDLPPTHFDLYHMSEQLPNPDSRVVLGKTLDGLDQRRARLDWQLTAEDMQKFVDGQKLVAKALNKVGAGQLIPFNYRELPPPGIRGGYHHMGTTRMSATPKDGVVNSDCRVHGTDNLYVAGSSVFATCGYANPTFTIGALALRLADHLSDKC